MVKLFVPLILFFLLVASCEKEVNFKLNNESSKIVVEGVIETGMPPVVRLSGSIGFFSKIDLQTLADAYVHDAEVSVSDGQQTVRLKEYTFTENGFPAYFYSVDTADPQALLFLGVPGKTYNLTIRYKGKAYTSATAIPFPKPLDSLWAEAPAPEEMPEDYPDSRLLFAQYTDPDTPGNRVRYFVKRNNDPYQTPYYSVYNDELINGNTIKMPLYSGFNKMDSINPETFGYFYKGDTVVIKWCAIDWAVYDFWQTLEYSYGASGNPFAAPVEISTNIKGGALGVWAGYGTTFDTLIINQ
ncbi:MAG TPA: DUF4249 family protein [Edaphocola sp.]|nr:DUF4249 family protein [Edaphocola sp.]